jgi:hypothetical protein
MKPPLGVLYIGADQVLPVVTILATVIGFILIFWNKILGVVRRGGGVSKGSAASSDAARSLEKKAPPQN